MASQDVDETASKQQQREMVDLLERPHTCVIFVPYRLDNWLALAKTTGAAQVNRRN